MTKTFTDVLDLSNDGSLLGRWNETRREYPRDKCVHQLFEEQVAHSPNSAAVEHLGEQLTYAGLNRRANQLAHYLRTLCVRTETPVGICLERSLDMVVALLGILKAGGSYVPLDPAHPPERLQWSVSDAQLSIIITNRLQAPLLQFSPARLVLLDADWPAISTHIGTNPANATISGNLVYSLYTSGSTGTPKGVSVSHRSVVRLVRNPGYAEFSDKETFLQFAPLSFDASTFEIWGPLLNGGKLVVLPAGIPSLQELADAVQHHRITTLWLTAGLFHQFVDEHIQSLSSVRQLLAGGDVIGVSQASRVLRELPGCTLINGYGPTEGTTFSCCYTVPDSGILHSSLPIGKPIGNTQAYVLDQNLEPVPLGEVGELYIGGDGLARCYLGRPDLTAEKFVPDPFASVSGSRLYRTGDQVRRLPGGDIEFLGRYDHQVKVRGYRIELGEIESVLSQHSGVQASVVLAVADSSAEKQLIAYVVPATGSILSVALLRECLAKQLPAYMVPGKWLILERLPLTANGKIDRNALPKLDNRRPDLSTPYLAPCTRLEKRLAELWSEVLAVESIGVHDNFLELGGHSLLATRIVSRIGPALQLEVPLRALFDHPTVAQLAEKLDAGRFREAQDSSEIAISPRTHPFPLSHAQQRMWFLHQMHPDNAAYNISAAVWLEGELSEAALAQSLQALASRHEILRTRFVTGPEGPLQQAMEELQIPLRVREISEEQGGSHQAIELATQDLRRPFDLAAGPLLRALLIKTQRRRHLLALAVHHSVADGGSLEVLWRDLVEIYAAINQGRPATLPNLPIQYADFCLWERKVLTREALQPKLDYWKRYLSEADGILELPTERSRPPAQSFRGALHMAPIPEALAQRLTALARAQGTSLFMTLLSLFEVLMTRYTGLEDFTFAVPVSNRGHVKLEALVGMFVNTLVFRSCTQGNPTFLQLLQRVKRQAVNAYAHQDLPFEMLVKELNVDRDLSRLPLFQVMFDFQRAVVPRWEPAGLRASPEYLPTGAARCDLLMALREGREGLTAIAEYDSDLFDPETIVRLFENYLQLLDAAVANPDRPIRDLPLLTAKDKDQLAVCNRTQKHYPPGQTLPQLLEDQVALTPDAVALIFCENALSYRELNSRANRLAHHLRRLGVGPEVLVGICAERSIEMVVGLLAVLKAGGAYVPLDPSYPVERLRYMVQDSQASVLLIQQRFEGLLPESTAIKVRLDSEWENECGDDVNLPPSASPDNLAYMIYTSGSTGTPKGAMNAHSGIANRLQWMQDAYELGASDRVLQKTPFSFDVSVWEFFWPLTSGAALVLAVPDGHRDPHYLMTLIEERQISTVHFVPSMLEVFLRVIKPGRCSSLRRVICSGEALSGELRRQFYRKLGCELHNLYGPTEAAVDVTSWACAPDQEDVNVPIGHAIANLQIHVLDKQLQVVPLGVKGELFIGGVGVGRGYWRRPDLTATRFLPDPFNSIPGVRMYQTGDLGRRRSDGAIEYIGRTDHQVKIRGNRIELGEIEAALSQHPGVRGSGVIVREDEGGKRIAAYVSLAPGQEALTGEILRAYLQDRLPEYMVPSWILILDQLPLSPSGKLDRKALPKPASWIQKRAYVPPRTTIEENVARLWAEILGVQQVGVNDNFFELGGHSLLGIQMISRIREELNAIIAIHILFQKPTLAAFAEAIDQSCRHDHVPQLPPIAAIPREVSLPLSLGEEALWRLDQLQSRNSAYNMTLAVRLRGKLSVEALEKSLNEIVRRHEVLRTTFTPGATARRIISPASFAPLTISDLRSISFPEREQQALHLSREKVNCAFDLVGGPLFRADLIRLAEQEHFFVFSIHHIISDGWSMGLLAHELGAFYEAYSCGVPALLPKLTLQYADYAAWQRSLIQGQTLEAALSHYGKQLSNARTLLDLPRDFSRPPVQTFEGETLSFDLSIAQTTALKELSQQTGVTLFVGLQTIFKILLSRWSGESNIAVGFPIVNRNTPELERLLGFFLNTIVLSTSLDDNPVFSDLLRRISDASSQSYAEQVAPMHMLAERLFTWDPSHLQPFQVAFNVLQFPFGSMKLRGLEVESLSLLDKHESQFDLELSLREYGGAVRGNLFYKTGLFSAGRMLAFADQFKLLVSQTVESPGKRIDQYSLATPALESMVHPQAEDLDVEETLPSRFARHALASPQQIALVDSGMQWSFADLQSRSNQIAQSLIHGGIQPGGVVAVCAIRASAMLVCACLGILKAGAAFLLLDASRERSQLEDHFELTNSRGLIWLLSAGEQPPRVRAWIESSQCQINCALPDWSDVSPSSWLTGPDGDPNILSSLDDLAGVTLSCHGQAHPVAGFFTHRQMVQSLNWKQNTFQLGASHRMALLSELSDRRFLQEMLLALWTGSQLCIPQASDVAHGRFCQWLVEQEITTIHLTPIMLRGLLSEEVERLPCLEHAFVGGDLLLKRDVLAITKLAPALTCVNCYSVSPVPYAFACHIVPREQDRIRELVPLGRGVAGTQLLVLTSQQRLAGIGELGEIHIRVPRSGAKCANAPNKRAEIFPNSVCGANEDDLYNTRDLGRFLPDGDIEFVGNNEDWQVVNGYKIQLAEIESALLAHPSIWQAAAIARPRPAQPTKARLEAYIACDPASELTDHELRSFLRARLPRYMVPKTFTRVSSLPQKRCGKLNRSAVTSFTQPEPPSRAGSHNHPSGVAPASTSISSFM
jgi:amino acid adenylation domain-containing protein